MIAETIEENEVPNHAGKYVTFKSGNEYFAIKIQYVNEIEEDYSSKEGYWITEDEFGNIDSITVYVKEIAEPRFYKYEWLERYL